MRTRTGSRGLRLMTSILISVVLLGLTPLSSSAFVATTININGNFDDWVAVRADPENVVRDSQVPDDPDWPGQDDRDIYLLGATYDSEYLYLSWRRTAGGTKAITFGAYLDYQGDGLLQDGDRVVMWTVSTGNPYASYTGGTARILNYNQARYSNGTLVHPAGDPMLDTHRTGLPTGDGETPDGWAQIQSGQVIPAKVMDAYLSPGDGIECEARVAWSDLGVSAGHPFALHFASGNGEAWGFPNKPSITYKSIGGGRYLEEDRGQVEDNADPILFLGHRAITVTPNNSGGGTPGSTITYTHTVTNLGNLPETLDLSALSSQGWTTQITTTGGVPLTVLPLAANSSATVLVKVTIPSGAPEGTQDVTTLTARSQAKPSLSSSATDTTRAGAVTVTPNQAGSTAPGQYIDYAYTVRNNTGTSGVFDLTTSSTLGFARTVYNTAYSPISTVTLAPGEARQVIVRVSVPLTATVGQQDTMRLTATLQGDPATTSSATGETTVRLGIDIDPDRNGYGGAGSWVQYNHTITNSWSTTRTVTLTKSSPVGWTTRIFAEDGITEILAPFDLGPFGATRNIIVRVFIPTGTAQGTVGNTVITATVPGGYSDFVTDRTTVRRLSTYADPGYLNLSSDFKLGATVFGRSTGLPPGSNVYFVWKDANGVTVRTSSSRTVDTQGMAFDEYTTLQTNPTGDWTVELRSTSGGTLLETSPFVVRFDATITALSASDAPSVGSQTSITSSVRNNNTAPISNSKMTYVIWWDSNGDGTFGSGDIYINSSGAPVVWDGVSAVNTRVTSGITVPGGGTWTEPTPWMMSNTQFPNQGTYNVTATWTTNTDRLIDRKTTQFYSIPALGWPLFALVVVGAAGLLWRRHNGFPGLPGGAAA